MVAEINFVIIPVEILRRNIVISSNVEVSQIFSSLHKSCNKIPHTILRIGAIGMDIFHIIFLIFQPICPYQTKKKNFSERTILSSKLKKGKFCP